MQDWKNLRLPVWVSMSRHDVFKRAEILCSNKEAVGALEKTSSALSILQYLQVYLAIGLAMYVGVVSSQLWIKVLMIVLIAGRQHSLYILNHDASHQSLFASAKLNQVFASFFSNLPFFHHPEAWSYIQWRRVHLLHHRHLFTAGDPNYVGREKAGDTKKQARLQKLWWRCLLAIPQNLQFWFKGRHDYVDSKLMRVQKGELRHLQALFCPYRNDPEMEKERLSKGVFYLGAVFIISYFGLGKIFLEFWLAPMYLAYPMILKWFDLTEHYWEVASTRIEENTRSGKRGLISKIFLSFLPRELHREHHLFPRVPVARLPSLKVLVDRK